ncbi:a91fb390-1aa4-400c-8e4a-4b264905ef70 [Sclerotinia trifoliorum]|uniref:A91fb390-1aa4-400c-8e4a-4b264905ef70 n=1 Tax=Sclerotinia trifoliorum TaxID=28548 RepID=A0A8H2W0T1_9HELO|nr:a91fb390-1aa4-400c-8e4a-4b264905ef70 [Sclerotinia trifoliorum]
MAITLHLIRHAQGFHNLSTKNHSMPDPLLTPTGKSQCETLSRTFPPETITHLIASPLRRTLYTALYSFPTFIASGSKVVALPELQETSTLPCDTGSEPVALAEEFAGSVDLELVTEGWNSKVGRWDANAPAIEKRAREARTWLRDLGIKAEESGVSNVNIVVVTHGGFLHYLSDDWEDSTLFVGTGWSNTEFRSYTFRDAEYSDVNASIEETRESRDRRKGSEKSLSLEEQRNLKLAAENGWQKDGFQQKVLKGVEKEEEGEERVKEVEVIA